MATTTVDVNSTSTVRKANDDLTSDVRPSVRPFVCSFVRSVVWAVVERTGWCYPWRLRGVVVLFSLLFAVTVH